jgi:hypothetical protein
MYDYLMILTITAVNTLNMFVLSLLKGARKTHKDTGTFFVTVGEQILINT